MNPNSLKIQKDIMKTIKTMIALLKVLIIIINSINLINTEKKENPNIQKVLLKMII